MANASALPLTLRVAVLADTHLRTTTGLRKLALPEAAWAHLANADVILHAGDILDDGVLAKLGEMAPVHAVLGNNDISLIGRLPSTLQVELGGARIAMVHDGGPARGRPVRLRRRFPAAEVVVFGHSHIPIDEAGLDGQRLFNPGSPTQRRGQPAHTMGLLEVSDGRLTAHRLITLDGPMATPVP